MELITVAAILALERFWRGHRALALQNQEFDAFLFLPRLSGLNLAIPESSDFCTRRLGAASMRFHDYAEAQTTAALRAPITRVPEPALGKLEACVLPSDGAKP